jgi:hypothetical protein
VPATSKSQQRLFGWVHAYQTGQTRRAPKKIKSLSKSISKSDARDFAATGHEDLPERKEALFTELGGVVGLARAPKGYRAEGVGRGVLRGMGTDVGALIGGVGAGSLGLAAAKALQDKIPADSITGGMLHASPVLGALIGGGLGFAAMGRALGRPRWEELLNRRAVTRADKSLGDIYDGGNQADDASLFKLSSAETQSSNNSQMNCKEAVAAMVAHMRNLADKVPVGTKAAELQRNTSLMLQLEKLAASLEESGNIFQAVGDMYPEKTAGYKHQVVTKLVRSFRRAHDV